MSDTARLTALVACLLMLPLLPPVGAPGAAGAQSLSTFPDGTSEKLLDFTAQGGGSETLTLATLQLNSTVASAGFRVAGEALSNPAQNLTLNVSRMWASESTTGGVPGSPPLEEPGSSPWYNVSGVGAPAVLVEDEAYFSTYSDHRPFHLYQFCITAPVASISEMTLGWIGWGKSYYQYSSNRYGVSILSWNWRSQTWSAVGEQSGMAPVKSDFEVKLANPVPEFVDNTGMVCFAVCTANMGDDSNLLRADQVELSVKTRDFQSYPSNVVLTLWAYGTAGEQYIAFGGTYSGYTDIGTDGSLRTIVNSLLRNVTSPTPVKIMLKVSTTSMGRVRLTFQSLGLDALDARLTASQSEAETGARIVFYGNLSVENITAYLFDYGDGMDSGWIVNSWTAHAYNRSGSYPARLMVKHANGELSRWSEPLPITMLNRPPVAQAWSTTSSTSIHDYIGFDSTGSKDPDGRIVCYLWEFGDGSKSSDPAPWHVYDLAGVFDVELTVKDDENATANATVRVSVRGLPPVVDFQVIPRYGDYRTDFKFVSLATDTESQIASWLWQFGDGSTSNQTNTTHRYAGSGTYIVTLTCVDVQDMMSYRDGVVVVNNVAPKAVAAADRSRVITGDLVNFTAAGSSDPDGKVSKWLWEFGDGTISSSENVSHSFSRSDAYGVKLTVTDDKGTSTQASVPLVVENRAPTARMRVVNLKGSSEPVVLDASESTDSDGRIQEYRWVFGDGKNSTGKVVTHMFKPGTYTVSLVVLDDKGASDAAYTRVVVTDGGASQSSVTPLVAAAGIPVALFIGLWFGRKWKKAPPQAPAAPPQPPA